MNFDFTSYDKNFDNYEAIFIQIAEKAFKYLEIKADITLSVSLVDNKFIHQLNKEYRKIDSPTDVISFAFLDNNVNREKLLKSTASLVLGDIYISIEKAKQQAAEYGHNIDRELSFLFAHGLLHLLGYDHMTEQDEEIMFPLQEKLLSL